MTARMIGLCFCGLLLATGTVGLYEHRDAAVWDRCVRLGRCCGDLDAAADRADAAAGLRWTERHIRTAAQQRCEQALLREPWVRRLLY
jgi:hypothetical protein